MSTCEFVRTLNGHKRGIACLQYRDSLVVSGSSDNTIRSVSLTLQWHTVSALTVLVGQQEGHLACKKTEWWGVGVVVWSSVKTCVWPS